MNDTKTTINIEYTSQDLKRLLVGLISLEVLFFVAHFVVFFGVSEPWRIARLLFNLDAEESFPTWFSSVQLFTVGGVLLLAAWANQHKEDLPSWVLAAGGVLFFFLSADEGSVIHERISLILSERVPVTFPIPPWIILYAILGTLVLVAFTPYLLKIGKQFPRASLIALGGGIALIGGTAGLETLFKLYLDVKSMPVLSQVEIATEELLEMLGGSIILYAALSISGRLCSRASLQAPFSAPRSPDAPRPSVTKGPASQTESS